MNVTSMLSSGYLQPQREALGTLESAKDAVALAAQERQVLAQERALKSSSGPEAKVSTTYRYSAGPDGRRYISGASVSIKGGEERNPAVPGESGKDNGNREVELGEKAKSAEDSKANKANQKPGSDEADKEEEAEIRELKRAEQEVVRHEAAHQAAAGGLGGGVSYSYTKGPDGKNYITGGEVPINMPTSDDPEETLRNMQKVQRAALAPANPSGQDMSVAGKAAAMAAAARQELAAENSAKVSEGSSDKTGKEEGLGFSSKLASPFQPASESQQSFSSGVSSVKAGLLFERLHGDETSETSKDASRNGYVLSVMDDQPDNSMAVDPAAAYSLSASDKGLWTAANGFDPSQKNEQQNNGALKPVFNIAA